jgi:putative ABC transport system substrate-binding protein
MSKMIASALFGFFLATFSAASAAPLKIAIANYGPHPSLQETIAGIKAGLTQAAYKEGTDVVYEISDVNFDNNLIPQMLIKLAADNPAVMITLSTPVSQAAKRHIKNTPLVFSDVTDPVAAGLIKDKLHGDPSMTGASEQQDLSSLLTFVKKILPHAKRIGLLYASGEDNDHALVKMMEQAAKVHDMTLVALPIDSAKDIPLRTRQFKDKVDFIYVGTSGPIQPSLPAVVSVADELKIPVFNADATAVTANQVLGSFAVSYRQVGMNTAKIVSQILKGEKPVDIAPIYPCLLDHHAIISHKKAAQLGIVLPTTLHDIEVVKG